MISKILVPTDGSKAAQKAAMYAVDLAKQLKATIIALSIIDKRSFMGQTVNLFFGLPSRPRRAIHVLINAFQKAAPVKNTERNEHREGQALLKQSRVWGSLYGEGPNGLHPRTGR